MSIDEKRMQLTATEDEAGLMLVAHAARVVYKETGHGFYLTLNPDMVSVFLYTQEAMKKSIEGGEAVKLETFYMGSAFVDNLDECGGVAEELCSAARIPCDLRVEHGAEAGKGMLVLTCGDERSAVFVPVAFDEEEYQALAQAQREEEVEGGAA